MTYGLCPILNHPTRAHTNLCLPTVQRKIAELCRDMNSNSLLILSCYNSVFLCLLTQLN